MQFLTKTILTTLAASFVLCLSSQTHAQTTVFTFDTLNPGSVSPLVMTQNGITATFTDDFGPQHQGGGPYDDGQFAVENSTGGGGAYSSAFSGNDLSSAASQTGRFHPLVILFSRPVYSVSLDFALAGWPLSSAPVTFSAFQDATLLKTQNLTAAPAPYCFFPEGKASWSSPQAFDKIVLNAGPAPFLIIDNVAVSANPVPETSSLVSLGLLLTFGLGGLAVTRRRQSKTTR